MHTTAIDRIVAQWTSRLLFLSQQQPRNVAAHLRPTILAILLDSSLKTTVHEPTGLRLTFT